MKRTPAPQRTELGSGEAQVLALPPISSVAVGKSRNYAETQFAHLQNADLSLVKI